MVPSFFCFLSISRSFRTFVMSSSDRLPFFWCERAYPLLLSAVSESSNVLW